MAGSPLFMRDVNLRLAVVVGGVLARSRSSIATCTPRRSCRLPATTFRTRRCAPEGSYSSRGKTTYALHVVAAQRWAADGLAAFLWDHDGELADVQYQAHGDGTVPTADLPGMTGEVTLVAGNYGGEVDTYAELDVTLAVHDQADQDHRGIPRGARPGRRRRERPATAAA